MGKPYFKTIFGTVAILLLVAIVAALTQERSRKVLPVRLGEFLVEFPDGMAVDLGKVSNASNQELTLRLINRSAQPLPVRQITFAPSCCAKGEVLGHDDILAPNVESNLRLRLEIGEAGGPQMIRVPLTVRQEGRSDADSTPPLIVQVTYFADQPRQAFWSMPLVNFGNLAPSAAAITKEIHVRVHRGTEGVVESPQISVEGGSESLQVELDAALQTAGQFGMNSTSWPVRVTLHPDRQVPGAHQAFLVAAIGRGKALSIRVPLRWTICEPFERVPKGAVTLLKDGKNELLQRVVLRSTSDVPLEIVSAECELSELSFVFNNNLTSASLAIRVPPNLADQRTEIRVKFRIGTDTDVIHEERIPCVISSIAPAAGNAEDSASSK